MQATPHPLIDVHHHFEPSARNVDGSLWSLEGALAEMDESGVRTAIAYAGPVFSNGGDEARRTNEWSAEHCRAHAGRFGLFASLPLNDVDAALSEITYAFDVLGADGVGLAPNYDGGWIGDLRFRPVFEELNRRRAVVYVHPSKHSCKPPLATLNDTTGVVSAPWIEFPTDTARTILSLWLSETTRQLPNIRFLFCHGGGVTPLLLGRWAGFTHWPDVGPEKMQRIFPNGIYPEFAKFYFELAQAYAPESFAMLRTLAPLSHILFGTDYSYFPIAHAAGQFAQLALTGDERRLIGGASAAALFPKWAAERLP